MDDIGVPLSLTLSIICLFLSFFFSMAETAFTCLNKFRFSVEAKNNKRSSKLICKVIDYFDSSLVAILVGNNLVNIVISITSTAFFISLIKIDESIVSLISSIIVTVLVYVFAEALPKQIAKRIPNKCARILIYPLVFFLVILFPLTIIFYGISKLLLLIDRSKKELGTTEDDFNEALNNNELEGAQEDYETSIIKNSFDFSDTLVKEVLKPKKDLMMIDIQGLTNQQFIKKVMNTNYSRIPVYYTNPNKILGIIVVKKILSSYYHDPHLNIQSLIDKPYIISPNIYLDELIDGFRNNKTEIAFVYSKNSFLGIVTLADVLEELVGPIDEGEKKQYGSK